MFALILMLVNAMLYYFLINKKNIPKRGKKIKINSKLNIKLYKIWRIMGIEPITFRLKAEHSAN